MNELITKTKTAKHNEHRPNKIHNESVLTYKCFASSNQIYGTKTNKHKTKTKTITDIPRTLTQTQAYHSNKYSRVFNVIIEVVVWICWKKDREFGKCTACSAKHDWCNQCRKLGTIWRSVHQTMQKSAKKLREERELTRHACINCIMRKADLSQIVIWIGMKLTWIFWCSGIFLKFVHSTKSGTCQTRNHEQEHLFTKHTTKK